MDNHFASYPCCVCGGQRAEPLYRIGEFTIARCAGCGMVYVEPRIRNEDIFDIYRKGYFRAGSGSGYEDYELSAPLRLKTFGRWYADLESYLPAARSSALDIGCAAGYFLQLLKEKGWPHIEGIELDGNMVSALRGRGLAISDVPLEQFVPARRYQLITLFDVLEHLPEINNDLTKLAAMLDDQGILALVTPDFSSPQRKIFGKRWFQFKPREHLYYFTPQTLRQLAEKHGLAVVHLQASGQFADVEFLRNRLARYRFPLLGRLFSLVCTALRLKDKLWYADTGSMFVVLKKKG
jgi:2-polyprenyl-3-methyl-5-hydroxy-6-metoxy-1,4-benzoquinol methylase